MTVFIIIASILLCIAVYIFIFSCCVASSRADKNSEVEYRRQIQSNCDRCVCCGEVVPEGRQVCPNCEANSV